MEYQPNEQAGILGAHLVEKWHPHLMGLKIAYMDQVKPAPKPKTKPPRAGSKVTWAKASKVTPKMAALDAEGYLFFIEFDPYVWDKLTLDQREALVDHELAHLGNDADGIYLKKHDLEEFRAILDRHGYYRDDIRKFMEPFPLFAGIK